MTVDLSAIVGMADWDRNVIEITPTNEAAAIPKLVEWFDAGKVHGVSLKGYRESSLPLLEQMRFIESLHIDGWCKKLDLGRLSLLDRLRTLRIGGGVTSKSYDLSSLALLESVTVSWDAEITGISSLRNLKFLSLWKTKGKDLVGLDLPGSVSELRLIHGTFESLKGLSRLECLTRLELSYLPRLKDITDIGRLSRLKILEMNSLKSIDSYAVIGLVNSLEELYIDKCAPINNIDWVKNLNNLEYLTFTKSKILDKDLSSIMKLDRLIGFSATQDPGYVPSLAEICRVLGKGRRAQ